MNIYLLTNTAPPVKPTSVGQAIRAIIVNGQPFLKCTVEAINEHFVFELFDQDGNAIIIDPAKTDIDLVGWNDSPSGNTRLLSIQMGWEK